MQRLRACSDARNNNLTVWKPFSVDSNGNLQLQPYWLRRVYAHQQRHALCGGRHHGCLRRDLSGNKLQNFSVNEFLRVAGQLEEL
jgi:hypothetical protein